MAIAIKKSSASTLKQTVTSSLPEEVQSQISNNTKLDTTDYTKEPLKESVTSDPVLKDSVTSEAILKQTVTPEEAKGKRSDDVVQLKFSKGKRAEAKAFFASCDVKMNSGFEMAYEFLKEEVQAERVKLSKSGIQRIKSEN